METIARRREEQALRTEQARQELINQGRVSAAKTLERIRAPPSELFSLDEGLSAWALGLGLSPKGSPEDRYLLSLASQYQVEQYQDSYGLMSDSGMNGLPVDPSLHRATNPTAVQLSEMMPLPVLMKHSVTAPLITHVKTLRELLTPLVLNSILNKALQYSVHGDSVLAAHSTFVLRYLPEIFHPHAPDSLNCGLAVEYHHGQLSEQIPQTLLLPAAAQTHGVVPLRRLVTPQED
ncbi:hypothetical protein cypCar_00040111, partial [Cyprinus carpio]